jgi:hypothetical protein
MGLRTYHYVLCRKAHRALGQAEAISYAERRYGRLPAASMMPCARGEGSAPPSPRPKRNDERNDERPINRVFQQYPPSGHWMNIAWSPFFQIEKPPLGCAKWRMSPRFAWPRVLLPSRPSTITILVERLKMSHMARHRSSMRNPANRLDRSLRLAIGSSHSPGVSRQGAEILLSDFASAVTR